MNPRMTRRVIHTPQMTIAQIGLAKGAVVPMHDHVNQQVTMVKSGVLEFEMGGERILLRAGDVLVIPPNVPHREENPSPDTEAVVVIARSTQEAIVVNVPSL